MASSDCLFDGSLLAMTGEAEAVSARSPMGDTRSLAMGATATAVDVVVVFKDGVLKPEGDVRLVDALKDSTRYRAHLEPPTTRYRAGVRPPLVRRPWSPGREMASSDCLSMAASSP
jgi:hypothetical protein